MLVICSLPEMYAKYKARWIEQQKSDEYNDISKNESNKLLLWNRLNNDGLTPLTLAADLGRTKMLAWLLEERRKVQWSYGDVTCMLHPLDQLDLSFHEEVDQLKFKIEFNSLI